MKKINLKKFRKELAPYDASCPFCREKIEMFCTHGCPACGGTGMIERPENSEARARGDR